MVLWALIKKELRLLSRDRLSLGILLGMPLFFIFVLGLLLGEGFGQKNDETLRISIVNLDEGSPELKELPNPQTAEAMKVGLTVGFFADGMATAPLLATTSQAPRIVPESPFPHQKWSEVVIRDLRETAGIRVEIIPSKAEARELVRDGKRAAVVVFDKNFSRRMADCSFMIDGINPFHRNGVALESIDAELLEDETQQVGASIIRQVTQVTLMRVILPYMIGRAFEQFSDPTFIQRMGKEMELPAFLLRSRAMQQKMGKGIKRALSSQFPRYNLLGKTWPALTKSKQRPDVASTSFVGMSSSRAAPLTLSAIYPYLKNELRRPNLAELSQYENRSGTGFINRGAARYQLLVPSYTVMFAFSLVLTVGWLFVLERRQGTLLRLRAAPIRRSHVLMGKFLPCFAVSVLQGTLLLIVGKLVFGMSWGPEDWSVAKQVLTLLPIIVTTSIAAMGLALFVAAIARTELQVALIGSLLVLILGLLSGCLIPPALLPESMREVSQFTPHAWALKAYRQLLARPSFGMKSTPNLSEVWRSCGVLTGYGVGFLTLAWGLIRLR